MKRDERRLGMIAFGIVGAGFSVIALTGAVVLGGGTSEEVKATELHAALNGHNQAAVKKWDGKKIAIVGECGMVTKAHERDKGWRLFFLTDDPLNVSALFPDSAGDKLAALKKGQKVRIVGTVEVTAFPAITIREPKITD